MLAVGLASSNSVCNLRSKANAYLFATKLGAQKQQKKEKRFLACTVIELFLLYISALSPAGLRR